MDNPNVLALIIFFILIFIVFYYFKIVKDEKELLKEIREHNETKKFITDAFRERYKYDLTNPIHEKLNSIPRNERCFDLILIRKSDIDFWIKEHLVWPNKVVIEFISQEEKEKNQDQIQIDYNSTTALEGSYWRVSPEWLEERLKLILNELKEEE